MADTGYQRWDGCKMNRPEWVPDSVFYQIFPDRFDRSESSPDKPGTAPWGSEPNRLDFQGGDLEGITQRLSHLERLGVSGIYLNPIFTANTNHRYDTSDYFTIDPRLGDMGAFRELIAEAHHRNIRVVLDGVFNHCGDGHAAFQDWLRHGTESVNADWFTTWGDSSSTELAYQTCGGASYLPKLNLENRAVRDYILKVGSAWLDLGIDGWRLDVAWKVPVDFWVEFLDVMQATNKDSYIVAEIWRDASPWLGAFHGAMNYQQRSAILDFCVLGSMDAEDFSLEISEQLARHGDSSHWMLNLVGGHDTPRILTVAHGATDRVRLAMTALFTLPGVPMIYYGDEIGLQGGNDPGCRGAMNWNESEWDLGTFNAVRSLATIRASHEALRRGAFLPLVQRNRLFAFQRILNDDRLVVVLNSGERVTDLRLPITGTWTDVLTDTRHSNDGDLRIKVMPGTSAAILVHEEG